MGLERGQDRAARGVLERKKPPVTPPNKRGVRVCVGLTQGTFFFRLVWGSLHSMMVSMPLVNTLSTASPNGGGLRNLFPALAAPGEGLT